MISSVGRISSDNRSVVRVLMGFSVSYPEKNNQSSSAYSIFEREKKR
jgi:hypothetical protein